MSVAGIDVGDSTSCIALARKGGVDVILNKESNRETPSVVTFNDKLRQIGTDAAGAMATNPRNTVTQIKRLLGKKFTDPAVQADLQYLPYRVVEDPATGGCLVEVQYLGEPTLLAPESVMAALLVDLAELAAREQGAPVTEAVLAVPSYFTETERQAMLAAAQTAGLHCLRLLNDTTATALAWGIYKTDLPADKPLRVVFVDVGYSATQACVVAMQKGQLSVLSSAWDRDLGGRNLDNVLFEHFLTEFEAKYKLSIRSNARACYRLRTACEKAKKVLTTNPETHLSVECLADDVDVAGAITRDEFEAGAADALGRLVGVAARAVEGAGLTPADIDVVEVIGGSSRVPAVLRQLSSYFGREPGRTLNATETVSRGAALQCAMLSPTFRVRDFQVQDSFPFAVEFSWTKDGEPVTSTVFAKGAAVPSAKMLTFYRSEPFTIEAAYSADSDLPAGAPRALGSYAIGPFATPAAGGPAKLKAKVTLNLNGIVVLENVVAVEEEAVDVSVEEQAAAEAAAGDETQAGAGAADEPQASAEPDAAAAGAAAMEEEPPTGTAAAKPAQKKRVKKTAVPHSGSSAARDAAVLAALHETEAAMALQARVQEETNDAKNAVEAYIYSLRGSLQGPWEAFETEARRSSTLAALESAEDWLYDEGEDQPKKVYVAKLAELQALGEPVALRAREAAEAPAAAAALRDAAARYADLAASTDERYAHITAEERERLGNEAAAMLTWLDEKQAAAAALRPCDDPVLVAADCVKKVELLERLAAPFSRPPPPKPKVPEPAPEPEADKPAAEEAATDEPMDAEPEVPEPEAVAEDKMQE